MFSVLRFPVWKFRSGLQIRSILAQSVIDSLSSQSFAVLASESFSFFVLPLSTKLTCKRLWMEFELICLHSLFDALLWSSLDGARHHYLNIVSHIVLGRLWVQFDFILSFARREQACGCLWMEFRHNFSMVFSYVVRVCRSTLSPQTLFIMVWSSVCALRLRCLKRSVWAIMRSCLHGAGPEGLTSNI